MIDDNEGRIHHRDDHAIEGCSSNRDSGHIVNMYRMNIMVV